MNPLPRNSIIHFEKAKPWTLGTSTTVLHCPESFKILFYPCNEYTYVYFIKAKVMNDPSTKQLSWSFYDDDLVWFTSSNEFDTSLSVADIWNIFTVFTTLQACYQS